MRYPQNHDYQNAVVVHESDAYRARICELLRRQGVICHTELASGKALLQSIRDGQWDIIFIPYNMPGASVLEIIDVLSEKATAMHVIVSGVEDPRIRSAIDEYASAKNISIVSFVTASVNLDSLAALLVDSIARPEPKDPKTTQGSFSRDEIVHALKCRDITAYFQPQHCLKTGALNGAELLVRWQHPTAGLLSPGHFLADLESFALGEDLLDILVDSLARLRYAIDPMNALKLGINVPARYGRSAASAERIVARLAEKGASCLNTVIEVTEDGDPRADARLAGAVAHWRISGMDCAIDDFGVASSSINRLCAAPFNILKLDRGVMQRALMTMHTRSLLRATIDAVHAFGMKVVAEGIETSEELTLARNLNCDIGQGYFFGAAMSKTAFCAYTKAIGLPKSTQASL